MSNKLDQEEVPDAFLPVAEKFEKMFEDWNVEATAWADENRLTPPENPPTEHDFNALEEFLVRKIGAFADQHFETGVRLINTAANSVMTVLPKKMILRVVGKLAQEFTEQYPEEAIRLNQATELPLGEVPGLPTKVGDFITKLLATIQDSVNNTINH